MCVTRVCGASRSKKQAARARIQDRLENDCTLTYRERERIEREGLAQIHKIEEHMKDIVSHRESQTEPQHGRARRK